MNNLLAWEENHIRLAHANSKDAGQPDDIINFIKMMKGIKAKLEQTDVAQDYAVSKEVIQGPQRPPRK